MQRYIFITIDNLVIRLLNEMLHASQNITAREECIKHNVEFLCRIQSEDIPIYEHCITVSTGVIIWFRTEEHIVDAIQGNLTTHAMHCKQTNTNNVVPRKVPRKMG